MGQISFSDAEYAGSGKRARRERGVHSSHQRALVGPQWIRCSCCGSEILLIGSKEQDGEDDGDGRASSDATDPPRSPPRDAGRLRE